MKMLLGALLGPNLLKAGSLLRAHLLAVLTGPSVQVIVQVHLPQVDAAVLKHAQRGRQDAVVPADRWWKRLTVLCGRHSTRNATKVWLLA